MGVGYRRTALHRSAGKTDRFVEMERLRGGHQVLGRMRLTRRPLDVFLKEGASAMATGLSPRHVPPRNGVLPVLLLTLVGLLVSCGAPASQPAGRTPTPTRELKGTITEFPLPASNSAPAELITGPDGNLWFVEGESNQIGHITPIGTITAIPQPPINSSPSETVEITTGPDGALGFTEELSTKIGRIAPSGTITEFPIPTSSSIPVAITTGPDGALWFEEGGSNKIGRITPSGAITEFLIPTAHLPIGIPLCAFFPAP